MGSFSVACSVSHITIEVGDPIVFLPLETRKYCEGMDNCRYLVSNEGPCYFYEAMTLPIFGEYDDYGYVGNIVVNDNTRAIEEHYGMTIDSYVNDYDHNHRTDPYSASMYIHKPIYDFMAKYGAVGYFEPMTSESLRDEVNKAIRDSDAYAIKDPGPDFDADRYNELIRDISKFSVMRVIEKTMWKRLLSDESYDLLTSLYGFHEGMSDEIIDLMIEFRNFMGYCLYNNTLFMPIAQHGQYCPAPEQLAIYREYVKLLEQKKTQYDKIFDDDYDDEEEEERGLYKYSGALRWFRNLFRSKGQ